MHARFLALPFALALVAGSASAAAQDIPGDFTLSGSAAIVSDYRFRGISQTDKRLAVQGQLSVSHHSGLYVSVWGSSVDDYVFNGADQEIDLIAGYRRTFGGTTIDGGILYYHYPGSAGANSDFIEPYLSLAHTIGPVTGKLSANYAPKQAALATGGSEKQNLYLAADLLAGVPRAPVTLTAHFGHSFGPSYLTIGDEYSDWAMGATYVWKSLTFGVSYVDTDGEFITPSGRNASKAGIVGSLALTF